MGSVYQQCSVEFQPISDEISCETNDKGRNDIVQQRE